MQDDEHTHVPNPSISSHDKPPCVTRFLVRPQLLTRLLIPPCGRGIAPIGIQTPTISVKLQVR
jgi:hypothetical protein